KKHCVKTVWRNSKSVLLKRENVPFDRFADVFNGSFLRISLADATRQTRTFRHPKAVLTGIEDHLSHGITSRRFYHAAYTLRVSETRSGRGVGGIGGILERSTGRYNVSRSTGTRPAARMRRSNSARGVNSEVF